VDINFVTNCYTSYIPKFMGLWRGLKPTIAKVHGYCVGGGLELALCEDLVITSDDARFSTRCHAGRRQISRNKKRRAIW
jgi:enoyl-CoA hydratase